MKKGIKNKTKMENIDDELNNLRMENEIKKIKLSLEHGADFSLSPDSKLSPELENQWLNHIQKFEDSYANCKKIVIYDLLEKPVYKNSKQIAENEITNELNIILALLHKKGIAIDTICKVDDAELYRFITEELFLEEIDDMMIEGMTRNFIYEEFHPNHEHDIKSRCKEFIEELLNKEIKLNSSFMALTDEMNTKFGIIKKEDAVKRMEVFREAFSSFILQHFKITSFKISEDTAEVFFDINYTGDIEGSNESKGFSGIGNFSLKCEYDYWCINLISIPGVPL